MAALRIRRINLDTCMVCGAERPPGHVIIHDKRGVRQGRVCSSHTLKEIVLDSEERFVVDIVLTTAGVEALERVLAKHQR